MYRDNLSFMGVPLSAGVNASSSYYQVGQAIGITHSILLAPVTPCSAGSLSTGFKALNAVQGVGSLLSAGQNASQGNYGSAALDLLARWAAS